jgi:hypothetical protein
MDLPIAFLSVRTDPTAGGLPAGALAGDIHHNLFRRCRQDGADVGPRPSTPGRGLDSDRSCAHATGDRFIRLKDYGAVATNSAGVPIAGNATYIVEFKYHILSYGSSDIVIPVYLIPAGDNNQQHLITAGNMDKSAPATGTFSSGAQTANAAQYYFSINASPDSDVVIDDIKVIRPVQHTTPPSAWASLESLPFPRLGKYFQGGRAGRRGRA